MTDTTPTTDPDVAALSDDQKINLLKGRLQNFSAQLFDHLLNKADLEASGIPEKEQVPVLKELDAQIALARTRVTTARDLLEAMPGK